MTLPFEVKQFLHQSQLSDIFEDGTYLQISDDQIIARIIEENGFTFKEGLEIEAYIYEDDEKILPLKMTPRTKSIVNDMLGR